MKTLTVTDEQYAFIQHLREEIAEDVVGKYGFVREQDAVQFLIDNLADDVDIDGEFDASATDDVAAAVVAAIEGTAPPDHLQSVSYIESARTVESAADEDPSDDDVAADDAESIGGTADEPREDPDTDEVPADESDSESGDADNAGSEPDETSEVETDDADADESDAETDDEDETDENSGAADDDDMLDRMMSLLDTHDDKWEESSAADFRYTVTLPDGSEENVQTKDDVRALLFKNY